MLTFDEFIEENKGNLTKDEFLKRFVAAVIGCDTCKHKLHDDFTEVGECGMGDMELDCKYELCYRIRDVIKGV